MGFKGKSISVASYDAGNRLTAWNRAGADENHSQTWDYDDAGNWNSTTKDGDTEGRNHSVSNQITQLDGKAVSYDLKGNLTDYEYDRTDYRVKYDLDNRIVEVKADSETIRYRYDALGRRIVSKGDDETVLIWWGDSECAEYEHRASQDAIQNDIMGDPIRLNSVIARDTEDRENRVEIQWYHKNYLDHVYAVSDDNGNLIEHYRYTAFGEPEIYSPTGARRNTSAIGNTVMWNTRRYDADNGLYYYKYRHYAANIGRWLGRDPINCPIHIITKLMARHILIDAFIDYHTSYDGANPYGFVWNEPINYFDVKGELAWFIPLAVLAARAIAVRVAARAAAAAARAAAVAARRAAAAATRRAATEAARIAAAAEAARRAAKAVPRIDDISNPQLRRRCQRMRKLMKAACSGIRCSRDECCSTLSIKIVAGQTCLRLRRQITQVCFGGRDDSGRDHPGQESGVVNAIKTCKRIHQAKGCGQSRSR